VSTAGASARDRILAAAVRLIAREGIDGVRIARIAMAAGVSSSLVHYHFADRETLLAEALEYSFTHAADVRLAGDGAGGSHAGRLGAMIDACLPLDQALREDWVLWIELWLRAVRHAELRPFAEDLYARLHAWFEQEIAAGVAAGEFARCDAAEIADRALALIDGYGIRTLIGDRGVPLERARQAIRGALAEPLQAPELLSAGVQPASSPAPSAQAAAARPVRTAPSM
jgi:AcrR family transcriptional regulator